MSSTRTMRVGLSVLGALIMVTLLASRASAQVVVSGGVDFANLYNFRGIGQNAGEVSIWPFVDFGGTVFTGDGAVKTVGLNVGTWNAIHTELADNKWYESDIYGVVTLGLGAASLGFTYTNYRSPADIFATVNELAVKLTGTAAAGGVALGPYAIVAFELGDGQADAGAEKGTYVELGIAPSFAGTRATFALPVKVGLSAKDYYEFGTGSDSKFGFFSIGGIVTVPMGKANIHGGVEIQAYGDNVKLYNAFRADDPTDPSSIGVIGSIGIGFAF